MEYFYDLFEMTCKIKDPSEIYSYISCLFNANCGEENIEISIPYIQGFKTLKLMNLVNPQTNSLFVDISSK